MTCIVLLQHCSRLIWKSLNATEKCFSLFRFDRRDEAQEAINSLNGVIPENGTEPLVVKIAEEHGKQKAAYYAGWQAGYNQSRGKYTASFLICLLNPLMFPAFMSRVFVVLSVSCLNIHSDVSLLVTCISLSCINFQTRYFIFPTFFTFSVYVKHIGSVPQI